jgi:hypothetical protein
VVWCADHAPLSLRKAFHTCPLGAWIIQITPNAAKDVIVEAWVRMFVSGMLIERVEQSSGDLLLLYAPSSWKSSGEPRPSRSPHAS